jgi:hypothetical protein
MTKYITLTLTLFIITGCVSSGSNQIIASKNTDADLTCEEVDQEIAEMNEIIADVNAKKTATHVSNVGTGVASHAVGMSGLPFVGAAISHAGGIANMTAAQRQELADQAQLRKNTLQGIAVGKNCNTAS